jgi:anti-sigma factor RsiW
MTHCIGFEARLNDYCDDLLSAAPREQMERHLRECAGCREALASLRSLRERTAALPRSLEPPRDLWPGIKTSLPPRRGGVSALVSGWAAGGPVGRFARPVLAAAAVVLIAAAIVVALRREAPNGITAPGAGGPVASRPGEAATAPAATDSLASLRLVEAEYRPATEQLQAALLSGRKGQSESPGAVKVIEENLRIVEGAIHSIHRAAEEDPGRAVDEQWAAHLYQTRFELLRQAVRLSSREGEERKS